LQQKSIFEKGWAEKPDRTSFATHMHFIVSDKNNVNFKTNKEKRLGECKYISNNIPPLEDYLTTNTHMYEIF
jgi:hypothetical protein